MKSHISFLSAVVLTLSGVLVALPSVASKANDYCQENCALTIDYQCRSQDLLMEVSLDVENSLHWRVQSVTDLDLYFVESGLLQIEEGVAAYSAIGEETALALKGNRAALVFGNNQALVFDCY